MSRAEFEAVVAEALPGARVVDAEPLIGGFSAASWVLTIAPTANQRLGDVPERIVIRRSSAPRADDRERIERQRRLLLHLAETPVPAPGVIHTSLDGPLGPYLILEHLDGTPPYAPHDPVDLAHQMADHLQAVHSVPAIEGLPQMTDRVHGRLALGPNPSPWEREAFDLLTRWSPPDGSCMLHGDLWPGNVIWDGQTVTGIIDWEDVVTGHPMAEVAITRVDLHTMFGTDAVAAFTDGFGLEDRDLPILAMWDLAATLRFTHWIPDMAAGWPQVGRPDLTEASLRSAVEAFASAALDLVRP